jgi:hypothetical protein
MNCRLIVTKRHELPPGLLLSVLSCRYKQHISISTYTCKYSFHINRRDCNIYRLLVQVLHRLLRLPLLIMWGLIWVELGDKLWVVSAPFVVTWILHECVAVCVHLFTVELELEFEFVLRPTDSRPVRLGIGPPFGAHDEILSFSFLRLTITLLFFYFRVLHPVARNIKL